MGIAASDISILERVRVRSSYPWILDPHGAPLEPNFMDIFERHYQHIQQTPTDTRLIIADPNPIQFLAKFLATCAAQRTVFLGNAKWVQSEWEQLGAIAPIADSWSHPTHTLTHSPTHPLPPNAILIPTGGTSGSLRFAIHTWDTLAASVAGFRQHFQVDTVNTCCVLPLYHVSGLMQVMRSVLSGGQIVLPSFNDLEQGKPLGVKTSHFFLSLVPTQLARLCSNPATLKQLQSFKTILLGGAPPWPDLLELGRRHHLPLAPTYGMTETASQVATLKPEEFLQSAPTSLPSRSSSETPSPWPLRNNVGTNNTGANNAGSVLPHAQITIQDQAGNVLGSNQTGMITIQSPSLALGYCSQKGTEWIGGTPQDHQQSQPCFQSNDLGFFDDSGYLHVVGRQRSVIISGGENIIPSEVESAIRSTGLVADVAVVGVSDRLWGEAVTAIYVPVGKAGEAGEVEGAEEAGGADAETEIESIKVALAETLNRIKHPKHWIAVSALPCNAQGKVNRSTLKAIAQTHLKT